MFLCLVAIAASGVACFGSKEEGSTTTSSAGQIGVTECDEYITKTEKCLEKMPEASRATFKTGIDATINAWKQSATTPEAKASLATGCKAALDGMKQSMGSFGCEF